MITGISLLLLLTVFSALSWWKWRKGVKTGKTEAKLENAEEVLKRVKLAKDAWGRLTCRERNQLRKRYGRD